MYTYRCEESQRGFLAWNNSLKKRMSLYSKPKLKIWTRALHGQSMEKNDCFRDLIEEHSSPHLKSF